MLRSIAATAAVAGLVALAGCGHAQVTPGASQGSPSPDSATLATFVMDTPPSPAPPAGSGAAGGSGPSSVCSKGQGAYEVLMYLVSSDTGTSVAQIADDLRSGQSLNAIAGAESGQVKDQALELVQSWLQFALANGKVTAQQARQYRGAAAIAVSALMAANVAGCVPGA